MNIRKHLLLSILSVSFISLVSNAQDAPPAEGGGGSGFMSKVGYGAKLGIGSSNFSKEQFRVGGKFGLQVGGFANYKVIDMLTVQLEVLYMQQGGKEYSTMVGSPITGTQYIASQTYISRITLHNLEIPLLAKVTPPGIGSIFGIKWHALVGPSLGINMGATLRTTNEVVYTSGRTGVYKYSEPLSPNDYETIQWGAYVGAGIETELKSFLLTIDVRYRQGLNDINYNYDIEKFINGYGDGRSNTLAVTVGLGF